MEDKMWWNHRVVRHPNGTLMIHEAYYTAPPNTDPALAVPHSITERGVEVVGEDIDGLRETLQRMLRCLDKPVLDSSNF